MSRSLVIAGALARKPRIAGHTWVLLQYLLGFRRLGWRTLFIDILETAAFVDEMGRTCVPRDSVNLRYALDVVRAFGLEDDYALISPGGGMHVGLPRPQLLERVGGSAFLLNVMGYLRDEEILARAARRVFLDIDPGFGQIWDELGLHHPFAGHDAFVTIGLCIGRPGCTIPTLGLDWIATPQPVVLEWWPPSDPPGEAFTTVASWRGAYGPVEFRGETHGLRVHQFRRFADLPRLTGHRFELALDIHPAETGDLDLLSAGGWTLADPRTVAGDPLAYRSFIGGSLGEFCVAKDLYVRTGGGWISDRSLCYLASGRPVLAQETGFSRHYPTGEGLLAFSTLEEAAAGVEEIARDPARHSRAARAFAEDYFDSDKVLGRLVRELGVA